MDELAGKYSGTVLICGSGPCLLREADAAINARPGASVMAINDAASAIHADFLCSIHSEKMEQFRMKSLNPDIITLSGGRKRDDGNADCWFTGCNSGGTSAMSAVKVARKMGFTEIILCGCPMNGGDGYFDSPYQAPVPKLQPVRFGNYPPSAGVVRAHQENLRKEAASGDYSMVRSMSGLTAEIFGLPDFVPPTGDSRSKHYAH
jgi:hypothetical protein